MKRLLVLLFFVGCGGGGSNGDTSKVLHCATPGVSLWCSAVDHCCADDKPYYCEANPAILSPNSVLHGYRQCQATPCDGPVIPVDYCGVE